MAEKTESGFVKLTLGESVELRDGRERPALYIRADAVKAVGTHYHTQTYGGRTYGTADGAWLQFHGWGHDGTWHVHETPEEVIAALSTPDTGRK